MQCQPLQMMNACCLAVFSIHCISRFVNPVTTGKVAKEDTPPGERQLSSRSNHIQSNSTTSQVKRCPFRRATQQQVAVYTRSTRRYRQATSTGVVGTETVSLRRIPCFTSSCCYTLRCRFKGVRCCFKGGRQEVALCSLQPLQKSVPPAPHTTETYAHAQHQNSQRTKRDENKLLILSLIHI